MTKQIKLIRLTTSLTLPLSLVLISPLASQANDNRLSDKTEWLTSSLDDAEQSASKQPVLQALSAQEDNQKSSKPIVLRSYDSSQRAVKLRPFIPNRKLPSRRDFESVLQAQQARMAATEKPMLNGQVAAFTTMPDASSSSYAMSSSFKSIAKPRTSWQSSTINRSAINTINRQIKSNPVPVPSTARMTAATLSEAEKYFQQTEHANLAATPPMLPAPQETVNPQQGFSFLQSAEHHLVSQPMVPVGDSFSVDTNPPMSLSMSPGFAAAGNTDASGFGSAGPPPFPLNLLPAPALKQLIRSIAMGAAPRHGNSPKSYFGSWHSGTSLSSSPCSYISNLPPTGFHSFIQPAYSRRRTVHSSSRRALYIVSGNKNQSASNHKQKSGNRSLLESQIRVAAYPAYAKQSLKSFNFMQ